MAFTAGYDGPRATRTWREHIDTLVELGFIWVEELGNREVGHILIVDPHKIVATLHTRGQVRKEWWNTYITRMHEIGAKVPMSDPD